MKNTWIPRSLVTLFGMIGVPQLQANVFTDVFEAGTANELTLQFNDIGNSGNAADSTGYGAVGYDYAISTYVINQDAITKYNALNPAGLQIGMLDMTIYAGIDSNRPNLPATSISWNEAAYFVNWLNTSQGYHAAYNTNEFVITNISEWDSADAWQLGGENRLRHKDALYFLPNEDEWYKAAYYDPDASVYYDYATGSDTVPTPTSGGTADGTAVYSRSHSLGPVDVDNAGGLSPYGTMGQSGNVYEWAGNRVIRSGRWSNPSNNLRSSLRFAVGPASEYPDTGFRVAAVSAVTGERQGQSFVFAGSLVPEPSSALLVALGGIGLLLRRQRG